MKNRRAISLLAAAIACMGALFSALAFSSGSGSYPLAWELLTTLPLLCFQLLSVVTSWRLQVTAQIKRHLVLALVISSISLFLGGTTLLVLVIAGLTLAPESRAMVLVLGAILFVLPLSSFLNAKACWQAVFAARSKTNEA